MNVDSMDAVEKRGRRELRADLSPENLGQLVHDLLFSLRKRERTQVHKRHLVYPRSSSAHSGQPYLQLQIDIPVRPRGSWEV